MELTWFCFLCSLIATVCLFAILWKFIRPKFSVRVTCWFCGERTVVPYGNKNCWDCPSCEQYNGFDQTGDYNKPIPAQYDERLNHPVGCGKDEFISGDEVLCSRCSQNQLLKVKQLANFVPYDEKNYDFEIEAFEHHLEKVYRLCLSCETRVQQELQIQNEALSKRLHNLNVSSESLSSTKTKGSFQMNVSTIFKMETDHRIGGSLLLHGISLVCAALLAISKLQLDSQYRMVTSLVFLHPGLLWLDRHVVMLALIGLFTGLMGKLLLGKYRLHIIDAIGGPVWLLVLLLQTGYIRVQHTWFDVILSAVNTLTCVVCLGINRKRRNVSSTKMTRLSLDPGDSCQCTTVSQFSSVSQPNRYTASSRQTQLPMEKSHDQSHDNLDDTLTELDSFTLGSPSKLKRTDSGIFSTVGQSSNFSNLQNQSVSQSFRKNRPLISPATFCPDTSTPPKDGNLKFGLFSTPQEGRQTSFTDQPLSGMTLNSRSFSVPKTTAFGSTPFSVSSEKTHLANRSLFITKSSSSQSATFSGRQTPSERSFSAYRDESSRKRTSVRKDLFMEEKEIEEDRISIYSGSTQCPVDSTTSNGNLKRNEPFWKHPALVGFVLGGSIVAKQMRMSEAQAVLQLYILFAQAVWRPRRSVRQRTSGVHLMKYWYQFRSYEMVVCVWQWLVDCCRFGRGLMMRSSVPVSPRVWVGALIYWLKPFSSRKRFNTTVFPV